MRRKLSESTYLSVGLVAIIIGGVMWLTSMHFTVSANAAGINKMQGLKDHIFVELRQIRESVARIEGFLLKQGGVARGPEKP